MQFVVASMKPFENAFHLDLCFSLTNLPKSHIICTCKANAAIKLKEND